MSEAAARDEGRRRYNALNPGAFCYSVDLRRGISLATARRCFFPADTHSTVSWGHDAESCSD